MAKGIIVVDDIPVICAECDYVSLKNNGENLWCDVKHKSVSYTHLDVYKRQPLSSLYGKNISGRSPSA